MARFSFSEHPASVGESYLAHMAVAGSFGWAMLRGSLACFVHALLPFLFTSTGSGIVGQLHARMLTHRRSKPLPDAPLAAE